MQLSRIEVLSGALHCGCSVMMGAFAAHALRNELSPRMLDVWEVGVRYQFYHGLALLILSLIMGHVADDVRPLSLKMSAVCFQVGIFLFSGSLYLLAFLGMPQLGIVTPFGGLLFLVGWCSLAFFGFNRR